MKWSRLQPYAGAPVYKRLLSAVGYPDLPGACIADCLGEPVPVAMVRDNEG